MGKEQNRVSLPQMNPSARGTMGRTPWVGNFPLRKKDDPMPPAVAYSHCKHLDLKEKDGQNRLCEIMDTIENVGGKMLYCEIRKEDWTAIVAWMTYQREPEDSARQRAVNLVIGNQQK